MTENRPFALGGGAPGEVEISAALKDGIRNPESGNGNGIMETETETEYGICERRFQAIDLKKIILAMTMK